MPKELVSAALPVFSPLGSELKALELLAAGADANGLDDWNQTAALQAQPGN